MCNQDDSLLQYSLLFILLCLLITCPTLYPTEDNGCIVDGDFGIIAMRKYVSIYYSFRIQALSIAQFVWPTCSVYIVYI